MHRRAVLAATWLSYFGFYFCRKAWSVVKADMQHDLGLSTIQIGNIGTVFLVTYMLGMFASAALGRVYGPRLLLLGGMLLSLSCNVLFGFATTYGALMALMAVNGLVQSAGWPGNVGLMTQWYSREERGAVMAWWSTAYSVGSAAAKAFAGTVVAWAIVRALPGYAWSYAFWAAAIVLLLIAAFFARAGQENPAAAHTDAAHTPWQAYLRVWRTPTVLIMGSAYFCFKFLRYALDSWAPYIFHSRGLSTAQAAWGATAFDWMGILSIIVAGYISDRVGRRLIVCIFLSIAMVGAFALACLAPSTGLLIVSFGLVGLTLYGPDSLLSGAGAADVAGDAQNAVAAAGIINGMGSLGPIVQEQIIPRLLIVRADTSLDLQRVLRLFVAMSVLAVVIQLGLWWRARRNAQLAF